MVISSKSYGANFSSATGKPGDSEFRQGAIDNFNLSKYFESNNDELEAGTQRSNLYNNEFSHSDTLEEVEKELELIENKYKDIQDTVDFGSKIMGNELWHELDNGEFAKSLQCKLDAINLEIKKCKEYNCRTNT